MRKLIILSLFACMATACRKEQTNPTFIFKEEPTKETVVINDFPLKENNQWTYTTDLYVQKESNSVPINGSYTLTCGVYANGPLKTYQLSGSLKKFFRYPLSSGYLIKHNGALYITQNPAIDNTMLTDSATCLLPKHIIPYEQTDYKNPVACRVIPVGYVKVTTPLGSFSCIKIQTEYFDGPNYRITRSVHYYSSKGLIAATETSYEKLDRSSNEEYYAHHRTIVLTTTNF